MKKFILALTALLVMAVSANAMSYEQARQQALFLTDKMAYELNLTDAQYEAAYEINLDYLMGVNTVDDLYGSYWEQRNLDLSYILLSWQYRAFCDAAYFYRPLYFSAGYWHFGIYARYPHRDYFFFGRPAFYAEYRGGHSWHMNGGRSWYHGRDFGPRPRHDDHNFGMRNDFNRGNYGNGFRGNPNSATSFGTARRPPMMGNAGGGSTGNGSFGTANRGGIPSRGNGTSFGTRGSSTRSTVSSPSAPSQPTFGTRRGGSTPDNTFSGTRGGNTGSFGSGTRGGNTGSFGSGSRPTTPQGSGSFGTSRSSGTPSGFGSGRYTQSSPSRGSFSTQMPSRSTSPSGSSMSRGSGSFGSGSRPSMSSPAPSRSTSSPSGSSRGGGSHFGSRR